MRLPEFILANVEPILAEWELFARGLEPGATMTPLALRNDAASILRATVQDMQAHQTSAQQASKSRGHGGAGGAGSDRLDDASSLHGVGRVGSGFNIMQVVSEYRALRASVLRLWRESNPEPDGNDLDDITRFNESIDQSLAKAVHSYTRRVDQSRRMFLAILAHDLRNPLNCIRMAAFAVQGKVDDTDTAKALSLIETHTQAITRLISDMIDFASTGLGSTMPLRCGPTDLERLCREVVAGFRTAHPGRTLHYQPSGDLTGDWDAARLRQVVTNLLGNAVQHGAADGPIAMSVVSDGPKVVLSVHNYGAPIPGELVPTIFDPLVRHATLDSTRGRQPGSIGLGLYIVREIVVAHGGTVAVESTVQSGTTFTVHLPRHRPAGTEEHAETAASAQPCHPR